jgi:hypothetical protein
MMRVKRSREGSLWWWCEFNASVSVREGRRQDKALSKDEAEAVNSIGRKRDTVRRCDDVDRGETTPRREKGGNNASWADVNLTGAKNKENSHDRFSWYKCTIKI